LVWLKTHAHRCEHVNYLDAKCNVALKTKSLAQMCYWHHAATTFQFKMDKYFSITLGFHDWYGFEKISLFALLFSRSVVVWNNNCLPKASDCWGSRYVFIILEILGGVMLIYSLWRKMNIVRLIMTSMLLVL